ncbi:MAG: glycerate kinase [Candidatus Sericytochromatia bacterium]
MSWLVATDSFKGSLSAAAASAAIARGLAASGLEVDLCPLSDGGEGFVSAIVEGAGGRIEVASTTDALGGPIEAAYGLIDGGETGVVELSSAAGLVQLPPGMRDPSRTTTYGVGALIAEAHRRHGFKHLLLGLGGSATVDGGAGLLEALGVRFLDHEGRPVPRGGGGLVRLARIESADASPVLTACTITLAVDVDNPLLGPRGAAPVYGPQKGADAAMVGALEAGLKRLAGAIAAATGRELAAMPGTGSAGGVPAGLLAFGRARMQPGFEIAAAAVGLEARLQAASLVVTGEGRLDRSSFEGKVVGRLAARCQALGLPLVVVAGTLDPEGVALLEAAGGAAFSLVPGPMPLAQAEAEAEALLERQGRMLARVLGWRV